MASLAFDLFSLTRLINSIKNEHSCKVLYITIGEMWIGITLAIVVELVPSTIRTSAVAVYLFIISNIGGNMPLLVPVIREAFENNGATKAEALRGKIIILWDITMKDHSQKDHTKIIIL